jgi:hypothetical protein
MGDTTLRELIYGKGAHVDPVACVEDIPAELAARTVAGYPHSIWQIVEHMNYWMRIGLTQTKQSKAGQRIRTRPPRVQRPIKRGRPQLAVSPICSRGLPISRNPIRRSWSEKFKTSARQSPRASPPCMPCFGKLRRITVITPAKLPCSAASLERGLLNVAAIPGEPHPLNDTGSAASPKWPLCISRIH